MTILVGIAVHGKAVAGVIAQPFYNYTAGPNVSVGRVIWAIVGLGEYDVFLSSPFNLFQRINCSCTNQFRIKKLL